MLDDVAATLALELGAQDPGHRAKSLSEYVKLPGSGDGFDITVYADGHETLNRTAHGPGGATSQPGAAAVIARYAAAIGRVPSQDEMAGFLAAPAAACPPALNPWACSSASPARAVRYWPLARRPRCWRSGRSWWRPTRRSRR